MKRTVFVLTSMLAICALAEAQTTIYFKRDTIYAGPGGGAIATVTPPNSDTTAPSAPSSLGTTSTTATSVALSWTGSSDSGGSGLAGYKVYRQKGSGANLPVGTVNSSTTAFTDQGPLEPSTGYTYTLVAFDNAQNHSSASNSVNPTTSSASSDTTAPTIPTNLVVHLTARNAVRVSWNASTDAGGSGIKGYKVYRNGSVVSGSNPITATTFSQTGLSYKTSYDYKVEAWDNQNNVSSQTSTVSITTDRQILFEDRFDRPDYVTLGSSWLHNDGNFISVDGTDVLLVRAMRVSAGTARALPRVYPDPYLNLGALNTTDTNFKVSVDVLENGAAFAGLVLYEQFYTYPYYEGDPPVEYEGQSVQGYIAYLGSGGGGVLFCTHLVDLGTCSSPGSGNTWSGGPATGRLSVETHYPNGTIKVYLDGTLKADVTVSNNGYMSSGGIGIFADTTSTLAARLDNFLIESN